MKFSFWICGLPVLLAMPLGGCGSSTSGTDASNGTLTEGGNTATAVTVGNETGTSVTGTQTVVVLPPEAPPMLLPDIMPPAPLANPVGDKDYGYFMAAITRACGEEMTPMSTSLGRSIDALNKLKAAPVQEPGYVEVITALREVQTAVEDTDARTKRISRYIEKVGPQLNAMEIASYLSTTRSHFQKALGYIQEDMTNVSREVTFMRDTCREMRNALSQSNRAAYDVAAAKFRDHKYEGGNQAKLALQEFGAAQQQYALALGG